MLSDASADSNVADVNNSTAVIMTGHENSGTIQTPMDSTGNNNTEWRDVIFKRKRTENPDSLSPNIAKRSLRDPRLNKNEKIHLNFNTYNKFSTLANTAQNQDVQASVSDSSKTHRPPPVHIHADLQFLELQSYLNQTIGTDAYRCVSTSKGVTVYPSTPSAYRTLVACLRQNDAQFHTYQLAEDKPFRIVIRGLHSSLEEQLISDEINKLGYTVRKVTNVLSRDKIKLPLFFVDLEPDPKNSSIFKIDTLFHSKICVEEPRQKRLLAQCTRCQRYGHTKRYCNLSFRCVKCAGQHDSTLCNKSRETPATCVLCGGTHPANYRGCLIHRELQNRRPARPTTAPSSSPSFNTSSFPPLPSQQVSSNKPATRQNPHYTPAVSYSNAVKISDEQPPSNIDFGSQLSSFISEMKQLITPMMTVMSQLIQVMLGQHVK